MNKSCREKILSDAYLDFILPGYRLETGWEGLGSEGCVQELGFGYRSLHVEKEAVPEISFERSGYNAIPLCYTLLDTGAMSQTGISALQNYPTLQLQGNGIMIGFIDTGIEYQNAVFRDMAGNTRIAGLWDQTIQTGEVPEGFLYGSEYTPEMINKALASEQPDDFVPSRDENGHGTFLASLAAGNGNRDNDFQGAAPQSVLGIVKLKEAKPSLKAFYAIREDAVCYQENDILAGLLYLHKLAQKKNLPLVICVALGTNFGGHNGTGTLADILQSYASLIDRCVVIGAGNEASQRHHFQGQLQPDTPEEVEIRVEGRSERGFTAELWARIPNVVSVHLVSPTGERSPEISIRQGNQFFYYFAFDQTRVEIEYRFLLNNNDSLLIFFRFQNPAEGIWKLVVTPLRVAEGMFHIWLPVQEFLEKNVYFLEANPNITVTEPGSTYGAITVAYYSGTDNAVDINSGRGYTRSNLVKPDLAAPGVEVTGLLTANRFVKRSGSSIAAGITAGACALIMEWLKSQQTEISTSPVANILILGAEQNRFSDYPNREWGYGTLDVYQALDRLRNL